MIPQDYFVDQTKAQTAHHDQRSAQEPNMLVQGQLSQKEMRPLQTRDNSETRQSGETKRRLMEELLALKAEVTQLKK